MIAPLMMLLAAPAMAGGPHYGNAGGIGSSTSTYLSGEPSGGTYSINGSTGVGGFSGLAVNGLSGTATTSLHLGMLGTFSPYELVTDTNVAGNNVLQLLNRNANGYSALSFRGTNPFEGSPTAIKEHGAIGWANDGVTFLEVSDFDATDNPGDYPPRFFLTHSGAIDPSGGTVLYCNLTQGSATITCPSAVPATVSGLYVYSFNIPTETQIASGGGTTTPVLTHPALATQTGALVRFWTPVYAQRVAMEMQSDDLINFYSFAGPAALSIARVENKITTGGGVASHIRQINGTVSSDSAGVGDNFIIWNSTSTAAKSETIPGCSALLSGTQYVIVDEANTATSYNITVTPSTGQIGYVSSKVIATNGGSLRMICDGAANWVPF